MKKIFILTTFLLHFFAFAQNESKNKVGVTANYHNRSCVGGTGFCSENIDIVESNQANATLQKVANNLMYMFIDVITLSKQELEQLKLDNLFTVSGNRNMVLNKNILTKLNIDSQFTEIAIGSYPIEIENDKVRVTFFLSKK